MCVGGGRERERFGFGCIFHLARDKIFGQLDGKDPVLFCSADRDKLW